MPCAQELGCVHPRDGDGNPVGVVEIHLVGDDNDVDPQFSERPNERNGEIEGFNHATREFGHMEVDRVSDLQGVGVGFSPRSKHGVVSWEGPDPQDTSVLEQAGEARAAEESDGDCREKAFVVCSGGVDDTELFQLAGSLVGALHGVGNRQP